MSPRREEAGRCGTGCSAAEDDDVRGGGKCHGAGQTATNTVSFVSEEIEHGDKGRHSLEHRPLLSPVSVLLWNDNPSRSGG